MTRRLPRRALALCAGGMLLLSSHPPAAFAEPADPPSAGVVWQTPTSARLSSDGSLSDVAGVSASSAWAVGQQSVWDIWQSRGAIAHWDGSAWSEVGVRNDPTGAGVLRSIAAASPTEVWAVGEGHDGLPYLARGDGTGFDRFAVDGLRVGDWLGGVAATGGRMVSVGRRGKQPMILTVTSAKRKVTALKGEGTLYGVALSGKDDGWAVGDDGDGPLLARLSGGRWKTVKAPDIPDGYLRDVHIDGPKRALAVGGVYRGDSGEAGPLILSWNGKKWSRVRVRGDRMNLYGVTGDHKGHFWISGVDLKRPGEAFLLRYDGRTLKSVRGAPAEARRTVRLQSVAYLPKDGGVLAVGHVVDAKGRYTDVIERFGLPERAKS
ncbi:hypothetical protein AB0D67_14845 [Streptosporangium sp. NPDC048047]|uniref:hypothetical protein n=1 Tax=Streptosporangium sp. NPDC048047 TaxID=3155748 RepID=UPI0034219424